MQNAPSLGPGTLIAGGTKILELVFQDAFYAIYSAETPDGVKVGITEYFPAELAVRAANGDVLVRSPELNDLFNTGRERFVAEARTLAALRCPNLLRFDGVLSDHGTALALHAVEEGQSMTNFVKFSKQPPPQEEVDEYAKQLVSAIEHLHSRNLIHANINPDTVFLRPVPLLVRFGAARSFLAARMGKTNLAVTPGYSAPELHFSDVKAHGPHSDIFSLAAVLYYLVSGRHPVNVIARGLGDAMPPVAAIAPQKFRPEFLEAISRGLELEPERRPRTVKAFGEMLLGARERKASESKEPALQAANVAEAPKPQASPPRADSAASPPPFPAAAKPAAKGAASPPGGRSGDEDDDEDEDFHDFGSGWRGLGLGRFIIVGLALTVFISAGVWMLEGQFSKKPEQSARLDAGKDAASRTVEPESRPSNEQPPSSDRARSPEQTPVSKAPAEPDNEPSATPPQGGDLKPAEAPAKSPPRSAAPARETLRETPPATEEPSAARQPAVASGEAAPPPPERTRRAPAEQLQTYEPGAGSMSSAPPAVGKPAPGDLRAQAVPTEPAPQASQEASAKSPAGFQFRDCAGCPELVVAPQGEFVMGSNEQPDEKPAHRVRIPRPFAIGQYEITYAEWNNCVEAGGCSYRPDHPGSPNDAIGNLSWDDANAYLKWLSEKTGQVYRLPSEAEWEYVARAGSTKRFWWGNEVGSGEANCADCGSGTNGKHAAIGLYKPNAFGLYDTAGNVAEWVQDCWNENYKGAPADGSAWLSGNCRLRVLRGGYFGSKSQSIRPAARFRYQSDVRYLGDGFRVLRELP